MLRPLSLGLLKYGVLSSQLLDTKLLTRGLLLSLSLFGHSATAEEIVPTDSTFSVSFISEHMVNKQNQPEHVTLKILSQPDSLKAPLPEHCLISGEASLSEGKAGNQVQVAITKLFCITAEKQIWDLNASGQLSNLNNQTAGISATCLKQEKAKCINAKLTSDQTYQLTFLKAVNSDDIAAKPSNIKPSIKQK